MKALKNLRLWLDPDPRTGPEAMAVDEWLLETADAPVLRVYRWRGAWASIGYFGEIEAARAAFPEVPIVRRWTGGGMVDHRADWTYSLIVPRTATLANLRGAESYRLIHAAVAAMLEKCGTAARLSEGAEETGDARCFENPVCHDLLADDGRKLAGAGQRRSRRGLLHQGSVSGVCIISLQRAKILAGELAETWSFVSPNMPGEIIERLVETRYQQPTWTGRR
jgi:lipoate-protein ligase A